jgi:hypothetical protein
MFLQNVDIYLQGHMASEVRENQHWHFLLLVSPVAVAVLSEA